MPTFTRPARRFTALLGTAAAAAGLAVAAPTATQAAPAAPAAASLVSARSNCPKPYPLRHVRQGMTGTGWTTSHGMTPRPFSVRVLGVLKDGISPGIDLIVIRANSPAIKRAGGVWAGMSGSPIYARDGRLLGALSYSFSFGPSRTAGVTPAGEMYKLFRMGAGHHGVASHVSLDARMRRDLVTSGAATPAQADGGMTPIPTPITVSGVPAAHLDKLRASVRKLVAGPFSLSAGGAVAPSAKAPASRIRPGAPFASAISTGDITFAGIGTTTAVCGGRAIAFGHPMLGSGPTVMTAHTANVLYIQRDSLGGGFVMANVGGRVGVVNEDRTVGLRARLGRRPANLTHIITHTSASTGLRRTGRTAAALKSWLPDVAANAVYGSLESTLQKDGAGSASMSYTIRGRRLGGAGFTLHRTDKLADQYDIAFTAGDVIYNTLSRIVYNNFRKVRINRVTVSVHAIDAFRQWKVKKADVWQQGAWVPLRGSHLSVRHGSTVHLRGTLVQTGQLGPQRYSYLTVHVPDAARGSGELGLVGGQEFFYRGVRASSFDGLLRALRRAPHNASVVGMLDLFGGRRAAHGRRTTSVPVNHAAIGAVFGQIRIS